MGWFVVCCFLSMLIHGFAPIRAFGLVSPWNSFISAYLFPFIVFIFAKNYMRGENDLSIVFHTLFFLGVYLSITAFFEFYQLRQFVFPAYLNSTEVNWGHMERARGPFLNAAFNGIGLIVGFVCGIHLLQKKDSLKRTVYIALLCLYFPAFFFTLTRAIYICVLLTLVGLLAFYKTTFSKWKLVSVPLALFLLILIANAPNLTSRDRKVGGIMQVGEVQDRLALSQVAFIMFTDNPFFGVGLSKFVPTSIQQYRGKVSIAQRDFIGLAQHNHLLGMLAELGLVGIIFYVSIVYIILKRCFVLYKRVPRGGILGSNLVVIIMIVWSVYLINNQFCEPSFCLFVNAVPFMFAGFADGLYNRMTVMPQKIIGIG